MKIYTDAESNSKISAQEVLKKLQEYQQDSSRRSTTQVRPRRRNSKIKEELDPVTFEQLGFR